MHAGFLTPFSSPVLFLFPSRHTVLNMHYLYYESSRCSPCKSDCSLDEYCSKAPLSESDRLILKEVTQRQLAVLSSNENTGTALKLFHSLFTLIYC